MEAGQSILCWLLPSEYSVLSLLIGASAWINWMSLIGLWNCRHWKCFFWILQLMSPISLLTPWNHLRYCSCLVPLANALCRLTCLGYEMHLHCCLQKAVCSSPGIVHVGFLEGANKGVKYLGMGFDCPRPFQESDTCQWPTDKHEMNCLPFSDCPGW